MQGKFEFFIFLIFLNFFLRSKSHIYSICIFQILSCTLEMETVNDENHHF